MRFFVAFLLLTQALFGLSLRDETGCLKQEAQDLMLLFDFDGQDWLQSGKERWELDQRFEDKIEEALPLLDKLGCIESIHATKQHYNYAFVLGSLRSHMQMRLDFLYEQWLNGVRFDEIVLLTGQRDLNPDREEWPDDIENSETALFRHLFANHPLFAVAPCTVIDSQKFVDKSGKLRRPDTAATIRDWLATHPKRGTILAVSTQPFVGYQHAVLSYFLNGDYPLETIGPKTQIFPLAIYLDNFAKWLLYESL